MRARAFALLLTCCALSQDAAADSPAAIALKTQFAIRAAQVIAAECPDLGYSQGAVAALRASAEDRIAELGDDPAAWLATPVPDGQLMPLALALAARHGLGRSSSRTEACSAMRREMLVGSLVGAMLIAR